MNDFTASNGRSISTRSDATQIFDEAGLSMLESFAHLDTKDMQALREFFQAEADERYGVWRSPGDPDVMVYEINQDTVRVHDPSSHGNAATFSRGTRGDGPLSRVARAYFDAHPEPKPIPNEPRSAWVDKYGHDVWVVGLDGVLRCMFSPSSDPAKYAPFTRLVPEEKS